jgi:Ca2+-transporting ATPase
MVMKQNKKNHQHPNRNWFSASIPEIERELKTNISVGLTEAEAATRLQNNGKNKLDAVKNKSWFMILLSCLVEPLNLVLAVAAIISLVVPLVFNEFTFAEGIECGVIVFTILANSLLGTIQEVKTHSSINALQKNTTLKTIVIRDGQEKIIDAVDLVVGDIVVLQAGKMVPADIRIFNPVELNIDESALTGESNPVTKTNTAIANSSAVLAEQVNLAFMSTLIVNGRANGIVVETAKNSEIGKIANDIGSTKVEKTLLQKKLSRLTRNISLISVAISISLFLILLLINEIERHTIINHILLSLSAAIAIIPASLNIIVSIILSISANSMSQKNVIVKKTESIENLGAVNIICSDKTGTLTQNKMTVTSLFTLDWMGKATNFQYISEEANMIHFVNGMALCNDATDNNEQRIGLPTELAIYDFVKKQGMDSETLRNKYTRLNEIPFSSDRKMMSTINQVDENKYLYVKGAIDRILPRCRLAFVDGKVVPLKDDLIQKINDNAKKMSSEALRVIVFAYRKLDADDKTTNVTEDNLIFLGAVGIIDPPRPEAIEAIRLAKKAGIRVVMITGDHVDTATVIASNMGIMRRNGKTMTGDELNAISDDELTTMVEAIDVFARVNPNHKTRIVSALQRNKLTVAMTGDGVNDSPSLKKADIGIAMGLGGSDAAKDAADVILTDDNFSSIINGVIEGRNAYNKIKRAATFVLSANPQVIAMYIIILIVGLSPLNATNILWFNLIVETLLAIPLGMSKSTNAVMNDKPRSRRENLFRGMFGQLFFVMFVTAATVVAGYFVGYYWPLSNATMDMHHNFGVTGAFIAIVFSPIYFVPFIDVIKWARQKNKPNWILVGAMITAFLLNLIMILTPVIGVNVFHVYPEYNYGGAAVMFLLSFIPVCAVLSYQGIYRLILRHRWQKNKIHSASSK